MNTLVYSIQGVLMEEDEINIANAIKNGISKEVQ